MFNVTQAQNLFINNIDVLRYYDNLPFFLLGNK